MSLSWRIALRYFLSYKKRSFISVVAFIAMIGVGVGTMAMVVVLSVFNGMEALNREIFKTFDPDVKITPAEGRRFLVSDSLMSLVREAEGVAFVTQVIEDNALAVYDGQQVIVRLKGVDSTFEGRAQLDTALVEGSLRLKGAGGTSYVLLSEGIRNALMVSLRDAFIPFELWYPRTDRKTLNFTSADAFNQVIVRPGGTFYIESRYDDYAIVPLEAAQELMGLDAQRSSLELQLREGYDPEKVCRQLKRKLGDRFVVQDRYEQNADLLRAIRVEKLFVTVTLSLIILVAAINIFFSLSMLAIEKKRDTAILYAIGAQRGLIRNVFICLGAIVALSGAALGLLAGTVICWLQKTYGLVSMGMKTALVDAYPVELQGADLALTAAIIILITMLVSFTPAFRASRSSFFSDLS